MTTPATSSSIGVLNAPGVRVTRFDPRRSIELGPLGVVAYPGILEKGSIEEEVTIGELIGPIDGPTQFERYCGGRIEESDLPRVCQDFFSHGGTRMYLVRVADGTQESSVIRFRNRKTNLINGMNNRAITIKAHNPGRWGGKKRIRFGKVYSSDDITGSLFTTGYADPRDAWKGGVLTATLGATEFSWNIEANTALGAVSTASDKSFTVNLDTESGWQAHGLADSVRATALGLLGALDVGALLADVIIRANLLKGYYNAHLAAVSNIHKAADVVNTIVADNATDQPTLNTLLNEMKVDFNLHVVDTTYHNAADDVQITSDDSVLLPSSITLTNEILTDLLAHASEYANVDWYVVVSSSKKRLSVEITDGSRNFADDFGIIVYIDGSSVYSQMDLSMNPDSGRYFVNIINNDPLNVYIKVTNEWDGEADTAARPANFYGYTSFMSATSIHIWPIDYQVTSPTEANGNVGGWDFGDDIVRDRLTLTFTGATTFTVESEAFGTLASGTVGTLYTTHADFGLSFMVNAGVTPFATDDEIVIDVEPMEVENSSLAGYKVYPDVTNYPRSFNSIKSNTGTVITGKVSDDYTEKGTEPTFPNVTGAIAGAGAEYTFNTAGNNALEVIGDRGEEQSVSVTEGAAVPLSTIISDLNDSLVGITASAGTGADAGKLVVTGDRGGKYAFLKIADGSLNAIVGFTDNTEYSSSSNGSPIRIQGPYELFGGSDGAAGVTSEMMQDAFDITPGDNGSPFNQIEDAALIKFATPTWSDYDTQNAGRVYAKTYHHSFRVEVPNTIFTESDAAAWLDDVFGRDDGEFCKTSFPSYAYIPNPDGERGTRIYACQTGAIHGREAMIAKSRNGYHKAEAGIDASLPNIVALGDVLDSKPVPKNLDLEFLNPRGLNGLRNIRGSYYMWGARTISTDPLWRFAHQAEQMSHYEHAILGQFDWAVFELNDATLWDALRGQLDDFFRIEFRKGALRGTSEEDAYSVRCDSATNPDSSIDEGIVQCEVELWLAGVAERIVIGISRKGINTTVR